MSDIKIDEFKLMKISGMAYNEIKKKESDGRSKESVVNKIIDMMKKELRKDAD